MILGHLIVIGGISSDKIPFFSPTRHQNYIEKGWPKCPRTIPKLDCWKDMYWCCYMPGHWTCIPLVPLDVCNRLPWLWWRMKSFTLNFCQPLKTCLFLCSQYHTSITHDCILLVMFISLFLCILFHWHVEERTISPNSLRHKLEIWELVMQKSPCPVSTYQSLNQRTSGWFHILLNYYSL